jgi:hypothetical protein
MSLPGRRGPPPCIVHGESPRPRFAASSRRLAAAVRCSPEKRVDNDFSRGVARIKENFHSSPCQPASPEFASPVSLSLSLSLLRRKSTTRIKRTLFRTGTRALPQRGTSGRPGRFVDRSERSRTRECHVRRFSPCRDYPSAANWWRDDEGCDR